MNGYWLNPYAIPNLVVGLAMLAWGWFLRHREAQSGTGVWAFGTASSAALWLLGFAAAYCSATPTIANRWISVSQAGVIVLTPMLYEFMSRLLDFSGWRKAITPVVWAIAAAFLILLVVTGDYLAPPYRYFWGFYAHYRIGGMAFAACFVCVTLFLSIECWRVWRSAPDNSLRRRRALLLLVGFGVGYLAAVDFIAALGVPVYAFGYAMAAFTVAILGYASWRYQSISVTSEAAAEQILKSLSDGVLVLDEMGVIARLNPRITELIGMKSDDLLGRKLGEAVPSMAHLIADMGTKARSSNTTLKEIELSDWIGGNRRVNVTINMLRDIRGAPSLTVLVLQDVTRYRNAIDKIEKLTFFDQATGLPNRRHLQARMDQFIKGSLGARRFALAVFRVEHVKHVLLDLHHSISPDPVLKTTAQRLDEFAVEKAGLGMSIVAGFLHGYHFALLIEEVQNVGQISLVLTEALTKMREPVEQGTIRFRPDIWLGVCLYPQDGDHPEQLTEKAIAAADQAASTRNENVHFYDIATNDASVRSLALSARLEGAIENSELELHFQPVVTASSGQIEFVEALTRWSDPLHGPCPPEEFIPVAEQSGLAVALDRWVLSQACAAAVHWSIPKGNTAAPAVAVNLSGFHLNRVTRGSLIDMVRTALAESKLAPDRLVLEITERRLVEAKEVLVSELTELREQGVRISMDDFGTGYASLSYLEWLPLDKLKIDQGFVKAIGRDARKMVLMESMLTLGKKLGLKVVAEGVEDPSQVDFLIRHGCEYLQGFWISRPVPAGVLNSFFQEWSNLPLSGRCIDGIGHEAIKST